MQCANLKRLLVCMQCRLCRRVATSLPKSMPFFTIISVGPGNQLVASFGYLQFCVLALAQPSVHVMNMHVSFGRGARHPSLHSHCQYTSCEGSCHQQVAQELCTTLRQRESSFNVAEDAMKQALASALIDSAKGCIKPSRISKKYQKRSGASGKTNSTSNGSVSDGNAGAGTPSRAASPEISSSAMLGPGSSMSAGSLGLADIHGPD